MYIKMDNFSCSANGMVTATFMNYEDYAQAGLVADILDKTKGLTAEFLRAFSEKQLRQYLARLEIVK